MILYNHRKDNLLFIPCFFLFNEKDFISLHIEREPAMPNESL